MCYFLITANPGSKLVNGMICGCSEIMACFCAGYILRYVSEISACLTYVFMCAGCNILYMMLGAGHGGSIAMVVLWVALFAMGSLYNAIYILVELRVPPENLGSSLCIVLTVSHFFWALAPNIAYLPQPTPLYVQLFLLAIVLFCVI